MKFGKKFSALFAAYPELKNVVTANKVSLLPRKELIAVAKALYTNANLKGFLAKYPTMTTDNLKKAVWKGLKAL